MLKKELLNKYADLILKVGINIQSKQIVFIKASPENKELVDLLVKKSYLLGSDKVYVFWKDYDLQYYNLKNADFKYLQDEIAIQKKNYELLVLQKAVYISLISPIPELILDVDETKLQKFVLNKKRQFLFFDHYIKNIKYQWTTVVVPNYRWAQKVFPNFSSSEALEKLWNLVFESCYINKTNFLLEWQKHNNKLLNYRKKLNSFNFKNLYFKNKLGTDLKIGLIKNHLWQGGPVNSFENDIVFNPNMPMQEVLTTPDKYQCEGCMVSTRPLNFQNKIIEKICLNFEKGKVVSFQSSKGTNIMKQILNIDEGASYLGEIALVPNDSIINNFNVLFFETLMDENTTCHLALGQNYPATLKQGLLLSQEELVTRGCNFSSIHIDICFGSDDLKVIGEDYNGNKIIILENGNFII